MTDEEFNVLVNAYVWGHAHPPSDSQEVVIISDTELARVRRGLKRALAQLAEYQADLANPKE